jgi:hypothetical protein
MQTSTPCEFPLADGAGHTFFMRQLLAVDAFPDRAVVDFLAKLSQLGDQAAQGELTVATAVQQPGAPMPFGRWPPILPGLMLPVSRRRRTQLITVLTPTR